MKKALTIALVLLVSLSLFAQGGSESASSTTAKKATKVGFVVINDESDQGYTWNFMNGMENALEKLKAEGYEVELLVKRNTTESSLARDNNEELAAEGCEIIFNNSYGFEPFMLEAAKDYPDTIFVGMTNCGSQQDDNPNCIQHDKRETKPRLRRDVTTIKERHISPIFQSDIEA